MNPRVLLPLLGIAACHVQAGVPPTAVEGVVVDAESGVGIPRALVRVTAETERGTATDTRGRFRLDGPRLPSRPTALRVDRICYRTATVDVVPGAPLRILLERDPAVIAGVDCTREWAISPAP